MTASYSGGYHREPKLDEIFGLLKEKSFNWNEIGIYLGVSHGNRRSIENEANRDRDRLERVLDKWLQESDQSKVTWAEFIRVLKDKLEYNDIVKKTKELLL